MIHIHANRLQGNVPHLVLKKGGHHSSFIADCGSPSDFDTPLSCTSCTMCCNANHECDVTESQRDFGLISLIYVGSVVLALLLISTIVPAVCNLICGVDQNVTSTTNEIHAIGKDSVYTFFLSSSFTAWATAIAVLATQTLCFVFFINAASLEFGEENIWSYSFSCPRDNLGCRRNSDVSAVGWIFFGLFGFIHLTCDMLNGLKLVWGASAHGFSKRGFHIFIGGCFLFTITAIALYATVVYNVATSRSDVEMIFNTVTLLFVNELDEKMFISLQVISAEWLEKITSEVTDSFRGNVRIDIQYAAANHEIRHEQTRKIEQIEKKLDKK
eukprot:15352612-Ditylum_brightwellii.AAC.1